MRKSQAAMEFLMTYGWAIVVVLVAISALAYFGVLTPGAYLPTICSLPSGISCMDVAFDELNDIITMSIKNTVGDTINDMDMTVYGSVYKVSAVEIGGVSASTGFSTTSCADPAWPLGTNPLTFDLNNNEQAKITFSKCKDTGTGETGEIDLDYTKKITGLHFTEKGSLSGKIKKELDDAGTGGGSGATPTCSDGIKNQDETGADCGGSCSVCCMGDTIPCALTEGVCASAEKNCILPHLKIWGACNYPANYEPVEKTCDDLLDNDCDGTTDDTATNPANPDDDCDNPPDCYDNNDCSNPADPVCESGVCVACSSTGFGPLDNTCDDYNMCTSDTCDAGSGSCTYEASQSLEGMSCDFDGGQFCDGNGNCVGCTDDMQCDDSNDCTDDVCNAGSCTYPNSQHSTLCDGGVCLGDGTCVECIFNSGCSDPTPVCDQVTHTCIACTMDSECEEGVCDGGLCVECTPTNVDYCNIAFYNEDTCIEGSCSNNLCSPQMIAGKAGAYCEMPQAGPPIPGVCGYGASIPGCQTTPLATGTVYAFTPNLGMYFNVINTDTELVPAILDAGSSYVLVSSSVIYEIIWFADGAGAGSFDGTDRDMISLDNPLSTGSSFKIYKTS